MTKNRAGSGWLALFLLCGLALAQPQQDTASTVAAAIQAGRYEDAATQLQAALRRSPSDAQLWNLLGIAETELHQVPAAEHAFGRGLRLAPDSASLNENAGLFFFRQASYTRAKLYLAHAVQLGSDKPAVRFSLAEARLRTGEPQAALRDLKAVEPALETVSDYWLERGRAELLLNSQAAESSFERSLGLSPRNITALNGAAAAAEKQGLDEKALSYLIEARRSAPEDIPTLTHFAAVCIRRDLGPDAIDALEKARQREPSDAGITYLLARAYISVQKWQQAHDLFQEFSRREPRFAPAFYALGWLDLKLNRVGYARRELEHSLALDPGLQDARHDLAELELDDGHAERAAGLLETVLRAEPRHARANTMLAEIRMRAGDLAGAQKLLETAIAESPKLAAAHYKLASVYTRLHEPEAAARERSLAAALAAEDKRESKTQLRLILPENAATQ